MACQLLVRNASKAFPGTVALSDAHLSVNEGQVVAVTGKNGAGKSVLMGIIAGTMPPDGGTVEVRGELVTEFTPWSAQRRGIVLVPQEVTVVPDFTVLENAALLGGFSSGRSRVIDWAAIRDRYTVAAEIVGAPMDYDARAVDLGPSAQRLLMIAGALMRNARLLILDEPTISASPADVGRLFEAISSATRRGVSVVYVSQRLTEVLRVASEVMVLRDGSTIGQWPSDRLSEHSLADAMTGTSGHLVATSTAATVSHDLSDRETRIKSTVELLRVSDLWCGPLSGVDIDVHAGEIVGLFGLSGSGKSILLNTVAGRVRPERGSFWYRGEAVQPRSLAHAIRLGIVLSPQSRNTEGIIGELTIGENVTLGYLGRYTRSIRGLKVPTGILDHSKENRQASGVVKQLRIVPADIHRQTALLSGGNQQKVVLGRWIGGNAQLFLLDEPMAGLDITAKRQVALILEEVVRHNQEHDGERRAALIVSSDPQDLERLCDRVYVLRNGAVAAELIGASITERQMMVCAGAET